MIMIMKLTGIDLEITMYNKFRKINKKENLLKNFTKDLKSMKNNKIQILKLEDIITEIKN